MARHSVKFTEDKIAQRIRDRYGRGEGSDYKGWFTVRDFSTKGVAHRFPSPELERTLLFLSNIEHNAFLVAANEEGFCDFWEQFPMEREETLDIARSLGYSHPVYFGTTRPVVMTLDGVASHYINGRLVRSVRDCKPKFRLKHRRTKEKLAIHEEYARRRGWNYEHFTEHSVDKVVLDNVEWWRTSYKWDDDIDEVDQGLESWALRLHHTLSCDLAKGAAVQVREYCYAFDVQNTLPEGAALRCLRLLFLHRLLSFDVRVHHLKMLRSPLQCVTVHRPEWLNSAQLLPMAA